MTSKNQTYVNESAEQYVVGSLLVEPHLIDDLSLGADDFGSAECRELYRAIKALTDAGQPVDLLTVESEVRLPRLNMDRLFELSNLPATTVNLSHHAEHVLHGRITRTAHKALAELLASDKKGPDLIAEIQRTVSGLELHDTSTGAVSAEQALQETLVLAENASKGVSSGLYTGVKQWDYYGIMEPGDVLTIAARPSMGKSALLTWLDAAWLGNGMRVLHIMTEGNRHKAIRRFISQETSINSRLIRDGSMSMDQWRRIANVSSRIAGWPMWFIDDERNLDGILRMIRRYKRRHKIDIVVIDHLQEVKTSKSEEYESATLAIEELRNVANETPKVGMVVASQLNREVEKRQDKRPQMSDLRGSGRIEEASDVICFPWRGYVYDQQKYEQHIMSTFFKKVRDGEPGCVDLMWQNDNGVVKGPLSKHQSSGSRSQEYRSN